MVNLINFTLEEPLHTPGFFQHLLNLQILQANQRRAAGAPAVRPRHRGHRRRRQRPGRVRRTAREAVAGGLPVAAAARQGALGMLQVEDLARLARTGTPESWESME